MSDLFKNSPFLSRFDSKKFDSSSFLQKELKDYKIKDYSSYIKEINAGLQIIEGLILTEISHSHSSLITDIETTNELNKKLSGVKNNIVNINTSMKRMDSSFVDNYKTIVKRNIELKNITMTCHYLRVLDKFFKLFSGLKYNNNIELSIAMGKMKEMLKFLNNPKNTKMMEGIKVYEEKRKIVDEIYHKIKKDSKKIEAEKGK